MASLVTFDLAGAATLIAGLRLRGYGYPSFKLLAEVYFNIDPVYADDTVWHQHDHPHHESSENAALGDDDAAVSDLADDTSLTVETGEIPILNIPVGYHLPHLHNILIADPGFNAPVLEKIQTPPADPTANPIQLFSAADLSHLSSHLAITATNLAQHAQPGELSDISDI